MTDRRTTSERATDNIASGKSVKGCPEHSTTVAAALDKALATLAHVRFATPYYSDLHATYSRELDFLAALADEHYVMDGETDALEYYATRLLKQKTN